MAITPLARDYLGRSLVQGDSVLDFLGRDIGEGPLPDLGDETDFLGRTLLPPAPL